MLRLILPALAALVSVLLVACSPYPEPPPIKPKHSKHSKKTSRPAGAHTHQGKIKASQEKPKMGGNEKKKSASAETPGSMHAGKPSVKSDKPVVKSDKPVVKSDKPSVKSDKPVVKSDKPAVRKPVEKDTPEGTKQDLPVAQKVLGKEGFVLSPYNNKIIDARGIPSGTPVKDETDQPNETKYFRVP